MARKASLVTLLFLVQFLLASCGSRPSQEASVPAVRVSVRTIGPGTAPRQYSFSGNLEGNRKVTLSTKLMGQITAMPFDIGMRVKAGELVVRIKSDDLGAKRAQIRANALEADAAFKNADENYRRLQVLYGKRSASKKELDDAEMMHSMASAKVAAVKEMENEINDVIGYGELRAPFDGVVVAKMAQRGDVAAPGMPLVVVEDASVLKVVAVVPESELYLFARRAKVRVVVDALETALAGEVEQINPAGDPTTRQFAVKIAFVGLTKAQRERLNSGMFARVILEKGTVDAITVPQSLVETRGELEGLFVVSASGKAMLRWIRTGRTVGEEVEVLSGLSTGERVILADGLHLKDGQSIEVVN